MEFVAGTTYQNASGRFRILSVGAGTLKLEYSSGPQAGRVLTKRTADMSRLATTEVPGSASGVGEDAGRTEPPPTVRRRR
jgi:hypothetical protein